MLAGSAGGWSATWDDSTPSKSGVAVATASRLDSRTQLDTTYLIGSRRWVPRWFGTVYPRAGEATMWEGHKGGEYVDSSGGVPAGTGIPRLEARPRRGHIAGYRPIRRRSRTEPGSSLAGPGAAEPFAEPCERSVRRSRRRVKLWCADQHATRLVSLTYAGEGQRSWAGVVEDVARFRRRLRVSYPEAAVLTMAEWHPGGHGWHVHAALTVYVPQALLRRCWGQGGAHVERFKKSGTGAVDARKLGRYVAKYLGKDADGGRRPSGSHAYEVTEGQLLGVWVSGLGPDGVRAALLALLGGPLGYEWSSGGADGWLGPPTAFLST